MRLSLDVLTRGGPSGHGPPLVAPLSRPPSAGMRLCGRGSGSARLRGNDRGGRANVSCAGLPRAREEKNQTTRGAIAKRIALALAHSPEIGDRALQSPAKRSSAYSPRSVEKGRRAARGNRMVPSRRGSGGEAPA